MTAPLARKVQLAAKVEATAGSAETLAAADAGILVENVVFTPGIVMLDRNPLRDSLSRYSSVPGSGIATLTFRCEVKGSGTATTPPAMGKFLRACGMTESVETGAVVYALTSTSSLVPTLTMAKYNDDRRWLLYGARGNVSFEGVANTIMWANFTFTGIYSEFDYKASLTSIDYEDTVPPIFRNTTTTFNFGESYTTSCYSRFTLDLANEVILRENANAASGLSYATITGRDPGGTFDLDVPAISVDTDPAITPNFMTKMTTPTTGAMSLVVGSTAGNRMSIAAPAMQVVSINDAERGAISVHDLTYKLRIGTLDDDELVLTFY